MGETRISQREKQGSPIGRNKYLPLGDPHPPQAQSQQAPQPPSKSTPKTTSEISQESSQAKPDFSLLKPQDLDFLPGEENALGEQGIGKTVEVEVLQDTQQEQEDRGSNSQGQNCIFMEGKIPGGGAAKILKFPKRQIGCRSLRIKCAQEGITVPKRENCTLRLKAISPKHFSDTCGYSLLIAMAPFTMLSIKRVMTLVLSIAF